MEGSPGIGNGEEEGVGHRSIIGRAGAGRAQEVGVPRSTWISLIHGTYSRAFTAIQRFHEHADPLTVALSVFFLNKSLDHTTSAA